MTRAYRFWTALEVRRLNALRESGLAAADIARELGRSEDSVDRKASRLGDGAAPLPPTRLLECWAAFRVPHRLREAARQLGLTYGAASRLKWLLRRRGFQVYRCPKGRVAS